MSDRYGWVYAEELRRHLDSKTARDKPVVLDEQCPVLSTFGGKKPKFSVELDFLHISGGLDCAVTAKYFTTGHVLYVTRQTVVEGDKTNLSSGHVEPLAADIVEEIWKAVAHRRHIPSTPADEPLPIRMHNATLLLNQHNS